MCILYYWESRSPDLLLPAINLAEAGPVVSVLLGYIKDDDSLLENLTGFPDYLT